MNTTRREFLQTTSLLAAALPLANVARAAAESSAAKPAAAPGGKRPLLFDRADVPRIRANTQLPRFKELWASLEGADLAADRKFIETEAKFNDHAYHMIRVRTALERSAFVFAITGREDHLALAKVALRKLLDYPKWDYFLEGGKLVMGLQRAPEATIAAAFALDWLDGHLTPEEVA